MAAPVYIPNWYAVVFTIKQGAETYHVTYNYRRLAVTPYTDAQLLAMATALYNIFAPGFAAIAHPGVTMFSASVRDMNDASGHEQTYIPVTPTVGTASGIPNPANVAGTISNVPTFVGKGVRGRQFLPGSTDNHLANQLFTSAYVASVTTLASALRNYSGLSTGDIIASVASRKHILLRNIATSVITNVVNNQIRRLIGHRRHKRHV